MYVVSRILRPTLDRIIGKTARGALEKLRRPTTCFRGYFLNCARDWSHHDHHLNVRFRQTSGHAQLKDAISFGTALHLNFFRSLVLLIRGCGRA
jgi:hypothetical protein